MTATTRLGKRLALAALAGLILLGAGFANTDTADGDALAGAGIPVRITVIGSAGTPGAASS
ncbi:hypothetical protein [Streptosporangium sp. NPDC051022]|uniref:hypothetical protein n=1 Tax=Streptosporangium sp. NPDC051022 TaxID=3155752 RepID=UPI0034444488